MHALFLNMNPDAFEINIVNRFDTMLCILWFRSNTDNIRYDIIIWCSSYVDFGAVTPICLSQVCRRHISKGDNNHKEAENTAVHHHTVDTTEERAKIGGA